MYGSSKENVMLRNSWYDVSLLMSLYGSISYSNIFGSDRQAAKIPTVLRFYIFLLLSSLFLNSYLVHKEGSYFA